VGWYTHCMFLCLQYKPPPQKKANSPAVPNVSSRLPQRSAYGQVAGTGMDSYLLSYCSSICHWHMLSIISLLMLSSIPFGKQPKLLNLYDCSCYIPLCVLNIIFQCSEWKFCRHLLTLMSFQNSSEQEVGYLFLNNIWKISVTPLTVMHLPLWR